MTYSIKNIDHLALVSGMCKEIDIAKIIDQADPKQSKDKKITYGQLVEAMILNGLGFVRHALHMYPEYFMDKPVERLLGEGVKAEHINDDALGKCIRKMPKSAL
jgi:transposase